jgi:formate hydrogenlyase subunit 6/NADH:ubiquinone oxidoreductase subunit I
MEMTNISIMGKDYEVPRDLTIMKALEYSGYRFVRGCGCRGGVCGACSTVYRLPGRYKIEVGLACQTVIEPGMALTQIPFYPANKAVYDIDALEPAVETILKLYPEVVRCLSCNTCTRACPQELEVMHYVQAAVRGDIEKVARLSFECIMCGLCASRCPAEIVQYNVAILCRRLYAKHKVPKAKDLADRVREVESGKFDKDLADIKVKGEDDLRKMYEERVIEPV